MRITEDVRRYAAEIGVAEEQALKRGLDEKSKEFRDQGAQVYTPS
jgi:phosphomethylpyrimidine synthase